MTIERHLAALARSPVPDGPARQVMTLSMLDWAACGIAGRAEPVSRIVRDLALAEGSAGRACLIGGGRAALAAAALVNGTISHALDYDDTHFDHIGHTSVAVIPAALAMAEDRGASFDDLVDAALIGAEAAIRVGIWLGRGHYEAGFHQTATSGAFGATLAAARLASLTETRTVAALGLAATRAAGLKSQFGTMGKPYNAGLAAQTGITAVQLAEAGMSSSTQGLSGPQGFGPTHHGSADPAALEGLGEDWRFAAVHHKFHACCHGLHAMLEALRGSGIDPASIRSVDVATHPRWLSVCDIAAPATGLEAKFSYRMTAAMALHGIDTADPRAFGDDMAAEPRLMALRDKVRVSGAPELGELQSRLRVVLSTGAQIALSHDLADAVPLAQRGAQVRAKAAVLTGGLAGPLERAVDGRDLAAFVAVLGGAG